MTVAELRALVASVPQVELSEPADVLEGIEAEVAYLESKEAIESIAADAYWPKWNGPWWILLLLHELGLTARIPHRIVSAMVDSLAAMPVHIFPIHEGDWPPDVDRRLGSNCHCAVGCIDQLLAASGVDVDRALPWVAPWFARYQMADGGYNCDESAYLVRDESPSSMVGTISTFEAMLRRPPSDVCDRAAGFLIERELVRGSATRHNAAERTSAKHWGELCFPRFYFYDVLRGAAALIHWASAHGRPLPRRAIAPVIEELVVRYPDGIVRLGRAAFEGKATFAQEDGIWSRRPAFVGSLLTRISRPGAASPALTRRWAQTRRELLALIDAGQLTP